MSDGIEVSPGIKVDTERGIVTIDGINYAREFFTMLATGSLGTVCRIEARGDGVVTLTKIEPAPSYKDIPK